MLLIAACGGGAPTVTTTAPANGATNVPITTNLSVTFSTAMNPATTEAAFSTMPATTCTYTWNPTNTTLTCNPTTDLAPSATMSPPTHRPEEPP